MSLEIDPNSLHFSDVYTCEVHKLSNLQYHMVTLLDLEIIFEAG